MIKSFLSGVAVLAVSSMAMAQGADLFPEFQGQFKTLESTQPVVESVQEELQTINDIKPQEENGLAENNIPPASVDVPEEKTTDSLQNKSVISADPFAKQNQTEQGAESEGEGNLKVTLTNLKGVLPYARDYAYCSGDLVLENETNQKLEALSIRLTYRDTPTLVSFGSVDKRKSQKQPLMLIGRACEDILSPPQVEVTVCKMPPQSEDSCKKRVQFIPPNS